MLKRLYLVAAFQFLLLPLAAQVAPAGRQGSGAGIGFWMGASLSIFNSDYGPCNGTPLSCSQNLIGVSPFLDTNFFVRGRVGLEGEAHLLLFHGPNTAVEDSFLGGPRVLLLAHRDLHFSGKFLLGQAKLDIPAGLPRAGAYFAYAPGAAIDFPLARHVSARVEYEYQFWPNFKCFHCTGGGSGGFNPNGFSFGVSYAISSGSSGTAPN